MIQAAMQTGHKLDKQDMVPDAREVLLASDMKRALKGQIQLLDTTNCVVRADPDDSAEMNSRQLARTWHFKCYKVFERELRDVTTKWFSRKGLATQRSPACGRWRVL